MIFSLKNTFGGLNYLVPDFNRLVSATGSGNWPPGTPTNAIEYITIATLGNGIDFGDLSAALYAGAGGASSTRGVFTYGTFVTGPTVVNTMEYITIASAGNSTDFGDTTLARTRLRPGGNSETRACFAGGFTGSESSTNQNVIDYITIATTGNATDFGDLTLARSQGGGVSSSTRGVTFGGGDNTPATTNVIDYITIASTGNSTDFGDLLSANRYQGGCGSDTRGVIMGALGSQVIQYITIASTGNATSFGNLTNCSGLYCNTGGSTVRGIAAGGLNVSITAIISNIEYITIASTGNSTAFGNLITTSSDGTAVSNCHGGL